MTTSDAIEDGRQEELEEWGYRFTCVVDAVLNDGCSLLDAPEDQLPCDLLDWAMATMQGVARPLRAACEELFPLSDELKAIIDELIEKSFKATVVKGNKPGEPRG